MLPEEPIPFQPLDFSGAIGKYQSRLPQWRQDGVTYYVTFRMIDSIPRSVFDSWQNEKSLWLRERGVPIKSPVDLDSLPEEIRTEFEEEFERKLNNYLDGCAGRCELRNQRCRDEIVRRFEELESLVGDFVIMPNHVHVLITPMGVEGSLHEDLKNVKGGSAFRVNRLLGKKGPLWQKDSFTRIVRSMDSLETFRRYIRQNPVKARLKDEDFTLHTARYTKW